MRSNDPHKMKSRKRQELERSGRRKNTSHTDAQADAPIAGYVPEAARRAEVVRSVVPGTAANHAARLVAGVLAPLPDVTVDLKKAPGIGLEAIDRHRAIPILALLVVADRVVAIVI